LKKILPITLLLLLLFSQVGYYIFFTLQQYKIKESVKRQLLTTIPETSLDIIDADINKNDIEWEEAGKEFCLHGQLYDVAAIKVINGKTLIYCLNDKKEEQLLKGLSKAVTTATDQASGGKNDQQHTIKFQWPIDYLLFSNEIATTDQTARQKHFGYSVALVSTTSDVKTPPPDLIF
jgi:hypothetical protein